MTVAAGSLNRRLRIQAAEQQDNPAHDRDPLWVDVGFVWASIKYTSGLKTITAGAETPIARASIRVRYRRDITMGMRLVHGDDVYLVEAALQDEDGREYVDLVCRLLTAPEVQL